MCEICCRIYDDLVNLAPPLLSLEENAAAAADFNIMSGTVFTHISYLSIYRGRQWLNRHSSCTTNVCKLDASAVLGFDPDRQQYAGQVDIACTA